MIKIKVRWVEYEYELSHSKIYETLEVLFREVYKMQGVSVEPVPWRFSEGKVDIDVTFRFCQRGDVAVIHFGTFIPLGEARRVVAELRKRGIGTIVISAWRPSHFGADGGISKLYEPEELAKLIRFVARKRR